MLVARTGKVELSVSDQLGFSDGSNIMRGEGLSSSPHKGFMVWEQGWELKSGCYLLRLFQILWDTSKQSTNSKFCSEVSTLEAWFSLAQGLGGVTSAS